MTAATRPTKRPIRWFVVIGGIASLVFLLYVSFVFNSAARAATRAAERARAFNEVTQLQSAILNFHTEYGVMPGVSGNAALIQSLSGNVNPRTGAQVPSHDNPRGIAFLSIRQDETDDEGEMVDPWGTPFRFASTTGTDGAVKITITSAGPDQIFGTPDDISNDDTPR
jgi:type II secretory pathway pseudopilin PulG